MHKSGFFIFSLCFLGILSLHAMQPPPIAYVSQQDRVIDFRESIEKIPHVRLSLKRNHPSSGTEEQHYPSQQLFTEINTKMYFGDIQGISMLLAGKDANLLTNDQKSELLKNTLEYLDALHANSSSTTIHQHRLTNLPKIQAILNVFQHSNCLKFPLAIFHNPYNKNHSSPEKILIALIEAEQQHIGVCCFHISSIPIAQALIKKKNERVGVEVVTNQTQSENNPSSEALKQLARNGILLRSPRRYGYETLHNKFFIFRKNIADKSLVWTGSYNPTPHSHNNCWENVIILDDNNITQSYKEEFKYIQDMSEPLALPDLRSMSHSHSADASLGAASNS